MNRIDIIGIVTNLIAIVYFDLMILLYNSKSFDLYRYIVSNEVLDKVISGFMILCLITSPIILIISFKNKLYSKLKLLKNIISFIINIIIIFTVPISFIIKFEVFSIRLFIVPIVYTMITTGILLTLILRKKDLQK